MTAGAPDRNSGDAAPHAARRARTVIALTVVLPFALAALLSVWRLGADARSAAGARTLAAAEAAAPGTPDPGAVRAGLAALERAGYTAAWYDAARAFARAELDGATPAGADPPAGEPPASAAATAGVVREDADNLPPVLPAPIRARLESLDRAFVARIGGRTVAIAPVRDADRWDMIGAIVAVPVASEPPRFPPLPLALAGLAIALVAFAGRARAAWPGRIAALLVFLPAAAFAALLMRAGVPEPPALGPVAGAAAPVSAGSHAFWAAVLLAGWAVLADIGLSLARAAGAPLRFREALRAWTFLAPSFAHLLVFSIGPILFALWLSFHEWNLLLPARPFIGLDNYRELAGDGGFWRAVRNTALYVLFVPAGMVVALGLALLANRRMPGVNLLRTAFFLPYVTSFVAISLVWKWMFQPDVGLLNNALERIGIAAQPWLSSPATALPSLMLMSVWMYAGYMMVIFLAGLQSIPATLYESARIDGAGPWRRFRHITLPLLRPTLLFILVTMVIFMFQVFTAVYVMTEGGPLHSTDVVVYHIYRNAWEYLRMGYASAMAWVLFAIVFAVTLIQFRWLGGRPAQ